VAKIDQNSIFLGREAHIPEWVYIMVLYINFYEFLKNSNFGSKSKDVSLQFYRKTAVFGKN
jgi:hypothetical protein